MHCWRGPPRDTDPILAVSAQGWELQPQQQKQQRKQPNSVSQPEEPEELTARPRLGIWGVPVSTDRSRGSWGLQGGQPMLATLSHGSMGVTRGSPPHCLTPSLRRCWCRRGARCSSWCPWCPWSARSARSARSDTRCWRCAWIGAGCRGTWYWHPPQGRYVLCHTPYLGTAVARHAKSHRATWQGRCRRDRGWWHAGEVQGDCPHHGALIHFAGIPQVGVQPGAKPPKFGTYLWHPAPGPPWTITGYPPPVAVRLLALLCVPCMPRGALAVSGPSVGDGILSPMGAKCHLFLLPWTHRDIFLLLCFPCSNVSGRG